MVDVRQKPPGGISLEGEDMDNLSCKRGSFSDAGVEVGQKLHDGISSPRPEL